MSDSTTSTLNIWKQNTSKKNSYSPIIKKLQSPSNVIFDRWLSRSPQPPFFQRQKQGDKHFIKKKKKKKKRKEKKGKRKKKRKKEKETGKRR